MAKGSGKINPDSTAGNARLGTGRGSNAGRSQPVDAKAFREAIKSNVYKATSFGKTNPMIGSYKGSLPKLKAMNAYNSTTSIDYTIPVGLGLIGGAAVLGSNALKERLKRDAIKKASVKTRKGQSRGR